MSEHEDDTITAEQVAEADADVETETVPPNLPPEPDPDAEPEGDTEPEPEPQQPASDMAMEQRYRRVEQAAMRYAKAVASIFGEDIDQLVSCPLCSISGTPAFLNVNDAGRIPAPVVAATQTFLGIAVEMDYAPDPEVRECTACGGLGKTFTGSKVPGNETRKCVKCQGFGYTPPPVGVANGNAGGDVIHFPAGERNEPVSADEVDVSGEPRILPDGRVNPNFGLWPQYKIQVPPWGTTIGLTAQDATG